MDLSDTIKAKSDQLNADDLICGAITVKILDVTVDRDNKQQPWKVSIDGDRMPYMPCLSMRRVMIGAWGDDGTQGKSWIGKRMRLFRDPEIKFGGLKCGGIRISHLSDLPQEEMEFVITIRKGAKGAYVVRRLADEPRATPPTEAEQSYIDDCRTEIEMAGTMEALKAIGFILKNKSEAVQNALRPAYAERKKELEATAE